MLHSGPSSIAFGYFAFLYYDRLERYPGLAYLSREETQSYINHVAKILRSLLQHGGYHYTGKQCRLWGFWVLPSGAWLLTNYHVFLRHTLALNVETWSPIINMPGLRTTETTVSSPRFQANMQRLAFLVTAACAATATKIPVRDNPIVRTTPEARQAGRLPSSFQWSSTGPLIGPKDDGRNVAGIKDPSIVEINGTYHVFASTAQESGYNLVYLSFSDFNAAGSAALHYLDETPIGTGYRAAPEVFYFEPQGLWYLIYQNGNAAYSTNKDISNPNGWSAPKNFYASMPSIISDNIGDGYWVDMWVICDAQNCHLFSSDDNGHLYRSQTTVANFPNGMSEPVIAMSDSDRNKLFEASCVYAVEGGGYLLLIEAIGSDGNRYFRSWEADNIAGPWTGLADTEANPFARYNNVAFSGSEWSKSISHGEVVRSQTDQTLTISPCNLRFLYQGLDPSASGSYNSLPWRLALITQTNSVC